MSESLVLLQFARGSRGSGPFLLQGQQFSGISFSFLTASVAFITSFYGWGISKGARLMHTCCDGCNLNLLNFFGLFLLWDIDLGSTVLCLWIIQCSYSVNRRLTVTKIIPCHIVPQFRIASMPTQVHANLIVLNCSQRTRPPKRKDMPKTSSTFESTEPHAVSRDSISLVTWATGRWPCCQHTEQQIFIMSSHLLHMDSSLGHPNLGHSRVIESSRCHLQWLQCQFCEVLWSHISSSGLAEWLWQRRTSHHGEFGPGNLESSEEVWITLPYISYIAIIFQRFSFLRATLFDTFSVFVG